MSVAVRRFSSLLCVIAAVTALYWPTALSYSIAWTDFENKTYTHGYLIVLMCIALLYLRREELTQPKLPVSPSAYGLLALLSLAWLLAYRASFQTVHQLIFPALLWVAIYTIYGRRIGRSCLFPLGFLYFAVPFWGAINGLLQAVTIVATQLILRLIGLPVHFDGNLVEIPGGTFAIEGGCSGLHFVVVAAAIAAFYGELHRDTLRTRAFLLGLAVVLALVTNWIRVSVIITAGHLTDMQSYLVRVSHYGFGWTVFAVAMGTFFLLASRMPVAVSDGTTARPIAGVDRSWPRAGAMLAIVLALAIGPALALVAARRDDAALTVPITPERVAGWSSTVTPPRAWKPVFIGADQELFAIYRRDAAEVDWYTAAYTFQRQERKLLGYFNSVFGAGEFVAMDEPVVTRGSHRFAAVLLQDAQGEKSLLWYVYKIGTRELTSGLFAQVWYAVTSLAAPTDSSVIAIRARCESDCNAAREHLTRFASSICGTSRFGDCQAVP